jgi:hypothetical protein
MSLLQDVSDERLRQMNEVLQGIHLLKLYGWEYLYGNRILRTRAKELNLLDKDSFYWAIMCKAKVCLLETLYYIQQCT